MNLYYTATAPTSKTALLKVSTPPLPPGHYSFLTHHHLPFSLPHTHSMLNNDALYLRRESIIALYWLDWKGEFLGGEKL